MRRTLLAITLAAVLSGTALAQITRGTIRVTVLGVPNSHGDVKCALFNSEDGFPKDPSKAIQRVSGQIQNGQAVCNFIKVLPGDDYAIAVFLGIPKEAVGASNDPPSTFGPPKYEEAKFKYSGGIQPVTINLH